MASDFINDIIGLLENLIVLVLRFIKDSLGSRDNKKFAYILSFLFPGIGVTYLGNNMKGIMIFLASVIMIPLRIFSRFGLMFSVVSFLIWLYGMYATYIESKSV